MIKGWEVGLIGMKKEEKRMLVIPPQYGYGNQTVGPIPGNSVLLFEISLKKTKRGNRIEDPQTQDLVDTIPTSSPNNKASMIERMKKLGAQTAMPTVLLENSTIEEDDDFGEETNSIPTPVLPQQTVAVYVEPQESEEAKKLREQMQQMKQQMEQLKKEQEQLAEEKKKKEQEELKQQQEQLKQQQEQLKQQQLQEQLKQQQLTLQMHTLPSFSSF